MGNLLDTFLNVIFTEGQLARRDGFFDITRRFGFADCKQRNFFQRPLAALCSGCDLLTDIL
jgi:hypothetical protein